MLYGSEEKSTSMCMFVGGDEGDGGGSLVGLRWQDNVISAQTYMCLMTVHEMGNGTNAIG